SPRIDIWRRQTVGAIAERARHQNPVETGILRRSRDLRQVLGMRQALRHASAHPVAVARARDVPVELKAHRAASTRNDMPSARFVILPRNKLPLATNMARSIRPARISARAWARYGSAAGI